MKASRSRNDPLYSISALGLLRITLPQIFIKRHIHIDTNTQQAFTLLCMANHNVVILVNKIIIVQCLSNVYNDNQNLFSGRCCYLCEGDLNMAKTKLTASGKAKKDKKHSSNSSTDKETRKKSKTEKKEEQNEQLRASTSRHRVETKTASTSCGTRSKSKTSDEAGRAGREKSQEMKSQPQDTEDEPHPASKTRESSR